MKRAVRVQHSVAPGMRAGELDRCFHSFASRRSKEYFPEFPPRQIAEAPGRFAGEFGHMALKHRGTLAVQLGLESFNHNGVIVADVMDTVPREEVQNMASVRGV